MPDASSERMSDYEAMRIHQYQDTLVEAQVRRRYEYNHVAGYEPKRPQDQNDNARVGEMPGNYGIIASEISSRAEEVYATHEARNRQTLKLLERAVDALRTAKGRKSVVLLSKGFIYDTELRGFRDVSRAAREANVAIYFIDARGLETGPSQFSAQAIGPTDARDIGPAIANLHFESAGSASVAEDSGGFSVENTNDLSAGFRRIAAESRRYYLLGYVSANAKRDGKYRRIEVKVSRPGVKVRARRGYYAPQDDDRTAVTRVGLDPDVQRALDAPREIADIPLRTTALVFEEPRAGVASVMLAAETDVRRFAFKTEHGRMTDVLEFAVVVTNRETGEVARFGQSVEMSLQPETLRDAREDVVPGVAPVRAGAGSLRGAPRRARSQQRQRRQRDAPVRRSRARRVPRRLDRVATPCRPRPRRGRRSRCSSPTARSIPARRSSASSPRSTRPAMRAGSRASRAAGACFGATARSCGNRARAK